MPVHLFFPRKSRTSLGQRDYGFQITANFPARKLKW